MGLHPQLKRYGRFDMMRTVMRVTATRRAPGLDKTTGALETADWRNKANAGPGIRRRSLRPTRAAVLARRDDGAPIARILAERSQSPQSKIVINFTFNLSRAFFQNELF